MVCFKMYFLSLASIYPVRKCAHLQEILCVMPPFEKASFGYFFGCFMSAVACMPISATDVHALLLTSDLATNLM